MSYTSSQAFSFWGGSLELGNADGSVSPFVAETFTVIQEIQMVDFTGSKTDLADVTNVESINARREFIATLIDSGECSFTANAIPTDPTQVLLQSVMDSRATRDYQVVLPGSPSLGTYSFKGIITSLDRNFDFSKEAKLTGKIKITGPLTFVA